MILFFPGLIPHCPLVPLFWLKIWRGTEWIIMGPRFHTNCTVAGAAVWKERLAKNRAACQWLGSHCTRIIVSTCSEKGCWKFEAWYHAKNLYFFFVCNEKCDTTLSFLWLFSTEKSLSAINICFWFYFTFFFFKFYSFTVLLLNFCFSTRKSQDIAVTEIQWAFLRRQMCWWLL